VWGPMGDRRVKGLFAGSMLMIRNRQSRGPGQGYTLLGHVQTSSDGLDRPRTILAEGGPSSSTERLRLGQPRPSQSANQRFDQEEDGGGPGHLPWPRQQRFMRGDFGWARAKAFATRAGDAPEDWPPHSAGVFVCVAGSLMEGGSRAGSGTRGPREIHPRVFPFFRDFRDFSGGLVCVKKMRPIAPAENSRGVSPSSSKTRCKETGTDLGVAVKTVQL